MYEAWFPEIVMPQAQSRDTLFAVIYNHDDSLTCIYTGYTIWLDPAQDPTQAAFQNNGPDALNTEHTFPQSLGASGLAEGDMHHLYPSRADANADRGNSPFAEIPDEETETWYYQSQQTSAIPAASVRDRYSEKKGDSFEPREDHKGNVARAMFYFYTMYKEQADLENSTFFESQRQTLCNWHFLDPVDETEWNRTWLIAQYQATPNPFVLDCTLPQRCYCEEFSQLCTLDATSENIENQFLTLSQNAPNPLVGHTNFLWELKKAGQVRLEIYDPFGRKVETPLDEWQAAGKHEFFWKKNPALPAGTAFYKLTFAADNQSFTASRMMVVLPN